MRTARLPGQKALDLAVVLVALMLVEVASWVPSNPVGEPIAGPDWLVAVLPLLLAVPLYWRRSRPLLVWSLVWAGVGLQALVTSNSPEGLELIFVAAVGSYSVAAHGTRRNALLGLAVAAVGYGLYAAENRDIRTGAASELWAGAFFFVGIVACWMLGLVVRERREQAAAAARVATAELEAERATAQERVRLARELHDIVAHNLSVVVLQAAGARAQGAPDAATLEKIERSGRESLVEMRRLLGVLRSDSPDSLAPQPGIASLETLADQVREAGVEVDLRVEGRVDSVPAGADLSAYRIVQEALTNVLRHAGPARAWVEVRCGPGAVDIEVVDDGRGCTTADAATSGHGLLGMRERVALFGGELQAEPGTSGGFRVAARLPFGSFS